MSSALDSKGLPEHSNSVRCSQDLESGEDSENSEMDPGEPCIDRMPSEHQRILDAMKAASEGNEGAQSFLFELYQKNEIPPVLKRLMEEEFMDDNG